MSKVNLKDSNHIWGEKTLEVIGADIMNEELSPRVERMLRMNLDYMDREFVTSIISQFGCEDAFFQTALAIEEGRVQEIPGFTTDDEVVGFLAANKKKFLEHIESDIEIEGYGSSIECIMNMVCNNPQLSLDEVAEGLHDSSSELHKTVARKIACYVGDLLVEAYIDQRENDRLRVSISSNGWPHISLAAKEAN